MPFLNRHPDFSLLAGRPCFVRTGHRLRGRRVCSAAARVTTLTVSFAAAMEQTGHEQVVKALAPRLITICWPTFCEPDFIWQVVVLLASHSARWRCSSLRRRRSRPPKKPLGSV